MNKKLIVTATLAILGTATIGNSFVNANTAYATEKSAVTKTTASDLYKKYNDHKTKIGESYKFTGKLVKKDTWGPAADSDSYLIFVEGNKDKSDNNLTLLTTEKVAKRLSKSKTASFTVKLTKHDSKDKVGDLKVISADKK